MRQDTDVFVVGGGPAGLAMAIAAARRGLSVTLADSATPPIDKACGEGIMPDGIAALQAMGMDLGGLVAAPLEGVRFVDAAGEVSARFLRGSGLGIRRSTLHAALTAKAEASGVHMLWSTRVEAVRQGAVVAAGEVLASRYVVCADGHNSSLRKTVGLDDGKVYRLRYGFRNHYKVRPWSPLVEVHWASCGQMYVTPVGTDDICVVFITSDKHLRLDDALPWFPELRDRLEGRTLSGRSMGGVTVTRKLKSVVSGRIALLGDSSGSADAITGDGLSLAFCQAAALVAAICREDLGEYQIKHQTIGRLPRMMGELMLVMDEHPAIRKRVFKGFSQSPEMFGKLLAMHTRTISPLRLGAKDCLSFGWGLLRA